MGTALRRPTRHTARALGLVTTEPARNLVRSRGIAQADRSWTGVNAPLPLRFAGVNDAWGRRRRQGCHRRALGS